MSDLTDPKSRDRLGAVFAAMRREGRDAATDLAAENLIRAARSRIARRRALRMRLIAGSTVGVAALLVALLFSRTRAPHSAAPPTVPMRTTTGDVHRAASPVPQLPIPVPAATCVQVDALLEEADQALHAARYDEAIERLERVVRDCPDHVRHDEAETRLRRVRAHRPTAPEPAARAPNPAR